jgi:pimeloyl-ACP methyl ester carboxylesterase
MSSVPTLPGIESLNIPTSRLRFHVLASGPEQGIPLFFIHGNFSGSTYWEEFMLKMPSTYHCYAPDLRGYGDTEDLPIDATQGARQWADDLQSLLSELNVPAAHFVGWSLGASAVMQTALQYPQMFRSMVFINPVSPYGFGGTRDIDGNPCYDDFAGSGGGSVNPEFVKRIQAGDRSADDPNSPRNVINTFYYKSPFRAEREEEFLSSALLERTGPERYPGDFTPSPNWPNVAPGLWGPINATSPKYFNTSALANLDPKPPILWMRGDSDQIVSDNSLFDFGTLGKLGFVPGWPGDEVFPPQPMVSQMRSVLDRYHGKGGTYEEVLIENTAHSPHIERPDHVAEVLTDFLEESGRGS